MATPIYPRYKLYNSKYKALLAKAESAVEGNTDDYINDDVELVKENWKRAKVYIEDNVQDEALMYMEELKKSITILINAIDHKEKQIRQKDKAIRNRDRVVQSAKSSVDKAERRSADVVYQKSRQVEQLEMRVMELEDQLGIVKDNTDAAQISKLINRI